MGTLHVYKFGGTSVADASCMLQVASLVTSCPDPVVVVVSAMTGVTNLLIAAAEKAGRGEDAAPLVGELRERHDVAFDALKADGGPPRAEIHQRLDELDNLLAAAHAVGGLTARSRDRIIAIGEKLSNRLFAHALLRAGASRPPVAADADTFLETDDRFGSATPRFGIIDRSIPNALMPLLDAGRTPVVTGFCGRGPCGSTTTLGRGGSDYTATLIAAALDATAATIWTDVPGVYSANPKLVPEARIIGQLNYREAAELSYYGAKVLHPRTIQPLIDLAIPAEIRCTFAPDAGRTVIDNTVTPGSHPVKAVSAVTAQALVSIEGTGMAGVPGIAARIFSTLASEGINVTMISQSSAESSVCVAIPSERASDAEVALRRTFRLDLAHEDVDDIQVRTDIALVAAVGLGMSRTPGVSGRVFTAMSRAGVNVVAIAQGASELNITFAVDGSDEARAIRALHEEFGLHRIDPGVDNTDHFDLILLGWGRINRALAALVRERAEHLQARFGATPRVVAISDRSGYLFNPRGLDAAALEGAAEAKVAGHSIDSRPGAVAGADPHQLLQDALSYRLRRPIIVDGSDADTGALYIEAFARGADVVTANKCPLATSVDRSRQLMEEAQRHGRLLRREATVGAGLPVIDTVEHLCATGDRITSIEGCLSGTLTFVLSQLQAGRPFDEVLADADERGYIEPNPLIDLAGEDVLRKAIILSRVAGFDIDPQSICCEGIVDRSLLGMTRDEFMARASEFNAPLAARQEAARAEGRVLRYVARVAPNQITVGPRAVAPDSALGALSGTDNLVLLRSERYATSPLAIAGPGAGVDVTAMGVLTDILRVVAERS